MMVRSVQRARFLLDGTVELIFTSAIGVLFGLKVAVCFAVCPWALLLLYTLQLNHQHHPSPHNKNNKKNNRKENNKKNNKN